MPKKMTATLRKNDGSELTVDLNMPEACYVGIISHKGVFYRFDDRTSPAFTFVETLHLEVIKVKEDRKDRFVWKKGDLHQVS